MNFFKKKEAPKKQYEKSFHEQLVDACDANTQGILSKLAHRRDEMLQLIAADGKEEDIKEGFEIMADYISSVPWNEIITRTLKAARFTDVDNNWTNRVDVDNAKYMINMQWKIIRVEMNEMIAKVTSLVEGDTA